MAETNREQWIAIFEAASANPPEAMNDEWEWLMDELALPLGFFPAVVEALRQGRWREAKNPKAYLKTVAGREAVKLRLQENIPFEMELVSPRTRADGSTVGYEETIEELIHNSGNPGVSRGADGVWRRGGAE